MGRTAALIALLMSSAAGAQSRDDRAWEALRTATTDQIAAQIEVVNEELEIGVAVSSEPVFRARPRGLLATTSVDHYLRAFIHKRTGETLYQVVFTMSYMGDFDEIRRATYATENGPESAELREMRNETGSCSRYGCRRFVATGFTVPRDVLEWAAQRDGSTDAGVWRFRLVSRNDAGERQTAPVEIAGFLARVDQVRHELGFADGEPGEAMPER